MGSLIAIKALQLPYFDSILALVYLIGQRSVETCSIGSMTFGGSTYVHITYIAKTLKMNFSSDRCQKGAEMPSYEFTMIFPPKYQVSS